MPVIHNDRHSPDTNARHEITTADVELYERARDVLLTAHHSENHRVAAALRGGSGAVYVGLHVASKRINVCAESSALANARMAQEDSIHSIVAVSMDTNGEPQVTNPCGLCRELLRGYGADAFVFVDADGDVEKVRLHQLIPYPWMRATETDWETRPPQTGGASS